MKPATLTQLLALRSTMPDAALLDCLELDQALDREGPWRVSVRALQQRWVCDQCTVSRRLLRLHRYELALVDNRWGGYRIGRIGPVKITPT